MVNVILAWFLTIAAWIVSNILKFSFCFIAIVFFFGLLHITFSVSKVVFSGFLKMIGL